jgi:hypothetical protein
VAGGGDSFLQEEKLMLGMCEEETSSQKLHFDN